MEKTRGSSATMTAKRIHNINDVVGLSCEIGSARDTLDWLFFDCDALFCICFFFFLFFSVRLFRCGSATKISSIILYGILEMRQSDASTNGGCRWHSTMEGRKKKTDHRNDNNITSDSFTNSKSHLPQWKEREREGEKQKNRLFIFTLVLSFSHFTYFFLFLCFRQGKEFHSNWKWIGRSVPKAIESTYVPFLFTGNLRGHRILFSPIEVLTDSAMLHKFPLCRRNRCT